MLFSFFFLAEGYSAENDSFLHYEYFEYNDFSGERIALKLIDF